MLLPAAGTALLTLLLVLPMPEEETEDTAVLLPMPHLEPALKSKKNGFARSPFFFDSVHS
ncbi:hypothetical protein STRDD11_02048 [Streptococcus sp. DD11]|nr:hypothetical protein STRDD11_02048 [Streptococcus sp. DD11]